MLVLGTHSRSGLPCHTDARLDRDELILDGAAKTAELRGLQEPPSLGPGSGATSAWAMADKGSFLKLVQGLRCPFHPSMTQTFPLLV